MKVSEYTRADSLSSYAVGSFGAAGTLEDGAIVRPEIILIKKLPPIIPRSTFTNIDVFCGNLLPQCEHFFASAGTSARH